MFFIMKILYPFQRIRRLMRNITLDLKMGRAFLGGSVPSKFDHLGAFLTSNTDYAALNWIFSRVELSQTDVLVDVGCGKGRAINWWLHQGLKNRIIGVELDPDIALATKRRMKRFPQVEIISGNIFDKLPPEGTVFFLSRPFNGTVLAEFKVLLEKLPARNGRPLIVYYNCVDREVFDDDKKWKMQCHEVPTDSLGQAVAFVHRASF
jgi:hypothetical protein